MTVVAAPLRRAHVERREGALETFAFALAVVMMLIYSQGWELPLAGGGDETAETGLIRALFFPAYGAGVALLALSPGRTLIGVARQPFLVALMLIVALSMFWSVSPDQTSRRIFALVLTTLGGVALGARYSWARLAEAIAAVYAIMAVLSLLVGLFDPSLGRMATIFPGAWRGLWPEKNTFGDNMAQAVVLCGAAALLNPGRARLWTACAALALGLVVLSTSKTSLVSLMLALAAMGLVGAVRRGPVMATAATWVAVVCLGAAGALVFFDPAFFLGLLGKDATLTGRTAIWSAVMRQIGERPWLGYGYAAIWDETDRWGPLAWITKDAKFRAHHAHNSWLEQWLALGVPGLAAWIGFYLQTLAGQIVALYRDRGAYLALPFFVLFTLTSLTESIAVTYNDLRWVILVALAVKLFMADPPPARKSYPSSPQLVRHPGRSGAAA